MTDDSSDVPAASSSRRRFLGTAVATGMAATAGCVGSLLDTSDSNEIEPEAPSEPRKGTPGEFYTLVERNDIPVESLRWDGSDLVLQYDSSASSESESTTEIEVITTVYNENLVKNDAEVDMLYAEVTNPFDGQAYGWGVKTEWCKQYKRPSPTARAATPRPAVMTMGRPMQRAIPRSPTAPTKPRATTIVPIQRRATEIVPTQRIMMATVPRMARPRWTGPRWSS